MTFYLDGLVFTTWKKWDYFCEEWCCCCRFRQTALVTPKRLLEEVRNEVASFSTNCGSLKKRHLLANTEIKQNNNSSFSENKSFQLFFRLHLKWCQNDFTLRRFDQIWQIIKFFGENFQNCWQNYECIWRILTFLGKLFCCKWPNMKKSFTYLVTLLRGSIFKNKFANVCFVWVSKNHLVEVHPGFDPSSGFLFSDQCDQTLGLK